MDVTQQKAANAKLSCKKTCAFYDWQPLFELNFAHETSLLWPALILLNALLSLGLCRSL